MKRKFAILPVSLAVALPLLAQKKQGERLAKSANAMKEILAAENGLPKNILDGAELSKRRLRSRIWGLFPPGFGVRRANQPVEGFVEEVAIVLVVPGKLLAQNLDV
jgi:hypothetical protein